MKYKIWTLLEWIDNKINHAIIERILGLFPQDSNTITRIWKNTCWRYCIWVHEDVSEWSEK